MITKEELVEIAKQKGYETVEQLPDWKHYKVYALCSKEPDLIIGRPEFLLVAENKIRFATDKEVWEILGDLNEEE